MTTDEMLSRLAATRFGVWTIKSLVAPFQRWIYIGTDGKGFSKIGSDRNALFITAKPFTTSSRR